MTDKEKKLDKLNKTLENIKKTIALVEDDKTCQCCLCYLRINEERTGICLADHSNTQPDHICSGWTSIK